MTVQHPKPVRVICDVCKKQVDTTNLDLKEACKDWMTYKVFPTSQSFDIQHHCPSCPISNSSNNQAYKGIFTLADLVPLFRG